MTNENDVGLETARTNRLLAALPKNECEPLLPHLKHHELTRGSIIMGAGSSIDRLWFPTSCVISLTTQLTDGGTSETGTVGREGVAGLISTLGNERALNDHLIQVAGHCLSIEADTFREIFNTQPTVRTYCLKYIEYLFAQLSQSVVCNAQHSVESRLARWLLMMQDRASGSGQLQLTQEFLAIMLGVHRPTVTIVARTMQSAGLIRYRRGMIEIIDREGLEDASCECYRVASRYLETLMPPRNS